MRSRTSAVCVSSCLLLCLFAFLNDSFVSSTRPPQRYGASLLTMPSWGASLQRPQQVAMHRKLEYSFADRQEGSPEGFESSPPGLDLQEEARMPPEEPQGTQASGTWSRAGTNSSSQQAKKQQLKGRLQRLRVALGNMKRRARERIRKFWQGIKRGAARVKAGARRAAQAIYRRIPKLRRKGREAAPTAEAIQPAAAASAGLAGLGLAAAAEPQGAEGGAAAAEAAGGPSEGETTPSMESISRSLSTKMRELKERQAEPPTRAPSGEESEEEFFEALSPEEYRQRYKSEGAAAAAPAAAAPAAAAPAAAAAAVPEDCPMFLLRLSRNLLWINESLPELCALWSLFMRLPNLTRYRSTQDLALAVSKQVTAAKQLSPADKSFAATKLRVTAALARAEDAVARAGKYTDDVCWFTRPEAIMRMLNADEEMVLNEASKNYMSFLRDPNTFFQGLMRIMNLAQADAVPCLERANEEVKARQQLQHTLRTQEDTLRKAMQSQRLSVQDQQEGSEALRDLRLLASREFCSLEILHLITAHTVSIKAFIADYKANGRRWWKMQWPIKLAGIMTPSRGSKAVPPAVAKGCKAYESSKPPTNVSEVSDFLEWMWEVALLRSEKDQQ
ncbi:hypothetical protein, conserved [Eimeria necatrix]|uniref:Uncharacterized protein n=1 Tax=Eimeria necatrix TaxID=51315 RepID=U6MN39_9EIME|nr:hypothetical protein, conserved [Eimeria necatrix]CDJ63894.1 hypothetical protein, conserved [Eimeria necatrix]